MWIRKEVIVLKLIIHSPNTLEKQALFNALVAKFHAEYVEQYIGKLNCPKEQKLKLIDAITETILTDAEKNI